MPGRLRPPLFYHRRLVGAGVAQADDSPTIADDQALLVGARTSRGGRGEGDRIGSRTITIHRVGTTDSHVGANLPADVEGFATGDMAFAVGAEDPGARE